MTVRAGFSLLEVLIVMAILALSIGAAVVLVRNQALGNLSSDAQIVSERLEDAQSKAIAGLAGSSWGIHFDNSSGTPFYALFPGAAYSTASTTYYLSGVVQFTVPAGGTAKDIVFSRLTGMVATTSVVTLSLRNNAAATATITVTPQGQISVSSSF